MNLLLIIGSGPGTTMGFIVLLILLLWKKKPGLVILLVLIFIIALVASQCEDDSRTSDLSGPPVSDKSVDEIIASIDHDMDSIASLPAYKMAGRILDSLGYEIHPSYLFEALDFRMMDDRDNLVIRGVARDADSIVRHFSMTFVGDPPVYQSVKIINSQSGYVVFSDVKEDF